MRVFILASLAVIAAAPAGAAELLAAECPAERAAYTLKEDPAFTAGLVSAGPSSDIFLFITSPSRTYWFRMGFTLGHGGSYIDPIVDPTLPGTPEDGPVSVLPDDTDPAWSELDELRSLLDFHAFGRDLATVGVPHRGEPAPAYLYMPGLTNLMWYSTAALVGADTYIRPDSMARSLFVLTACRDGLPAANP